MQARQVSIFSHVGGGRNPYSAVHFHLNVFKHKINHNNPFIHLEVLPWSQYKKEKKNC